MRLSLSPGTRRLLRLLPRDRVYSLLELLLLSLLAVQCARLAWILLAPIGPVGDWRPPAPAAATSSASRAILAEFDPFFRLTGGGGPLVVTSLNIKLFGTREDRATGRGSAIIAAADGQQRSFAVGEEVMPGVILTAVGFDNVTITRNGAAEQLFLDQSQPATSVAPPPPPPSVALSPSIVAAPPPPVVNPPVVETTPEPGQ